MVNKIDTNFGTVGYNISFNKDIPLVWRTYISKMIENAIKLSNREYQDYLIIPNDIKKEIDWTC